LKCIFVSDLHGSIQKFQKLFITIKKEELDGVFIGGDILPNQFKIKKSLNDFLEENFFLEIKKLKNPPTFFVILGNDDPRVYEELFLDAEKRGLIKYIHNKTVNFGNLFVSGYSCIPPSPFQLKDWEKYDVSRFNDVGVISPEEGFRTVEISKDEIRYSTISEDLNNLSKNAPVDKTIFLFHSPPYKTKLDRADLDGKKVDHVPVDVYVGSIAIKRFIDKNQPFLTLHGHVHETVRLTGKWKEKFGQTYSYSAAHDGKELAIVKFDTENLENAVRLLI
jgi:Icc-related predicted phosphoesterase